ncbi:MAG: Tritrans,polycis-undecaprenyl-diphosphate synthase (GGDP specific) [Methanoregulaceae archaeon PtaU1.Bin059]|nr:MAG: Tritrans,polycis-undecaprenyl-diphosphate synthase (GGDP specific) [Methanoregulaceae archaeon PtaB.Bin152]OPY42573.1 MAG: Tritrans,polycis-undecaprenyl-diphosphate synthase (GGDP specific) [Methanoregulaceae archaeon PtaU1.Bin059]
MIRWLYERRLLSGLSILPAQICFMITGEDVEEAPGKLVEVSRWCVEVSDAVVNACKGEAGKDTLGGIRGVTFHISTRGREDELSCIGRFREVAHFARLTLHHGSTAETEGEGIDVHVAVGKSGREEITECIRKMAKDGLSPGEVTEHAIEERLTFRYTPDLVIKTGGSHLTDFLIWQSVYSELFFSDVNWALFRKTDFLRALRDYQSRVRRFGR